MRIGPLLAAVAFASVPVEAPALAGETAVEPALAAGEVLVEIDATGRSVAPAHRARLVVTVSGRAATAQDERRDVEAKVARATAAARAAGVAAADINPHPGLTRIGFIGNGAPEDYEMPAPIVQSESAIERRALRMLDIVVRNPAAAERVRDALEETGSVVVLGYEGADGDAARRTARADAFRRAVADAEALATAAGMRVARVLRISERTGPEAFTATMLRRMSG